MRTVINEPKKKYRACDRIILDVATAQKPDVNSKLAQINVRIYSLQLLWPHKAGEKIH